MKRRFANKPDWSRVLRKEFKIEFIDNEELRGYVSSIYMKKITEPLIIQTKGVDYCIVDKGYSWIQYFPENKNFVLTVMIDEKDNIIQWYFDISEKYELTEDGVPFYDDLFLDIVVLTTGEVILLDEDELQDALSKEEITEKQYEDATKQAQELIVWINENFEKLNELTKKYYYYLQNISQEINYI
jgi:predicted RNA-binding protein associated with RNAse of E/G family